MIKCNWAAMLMHPFAVSIMHSAAGLHFRACPQHDATLCVCTQKYSMPAVPDTWAIYRSVERCTTSSASSSILVKAAYRWLNFQGFNASLMRATCSSIMLGAAGNETMQAITEHVQSVKPARDHLSEQLRLCSVCGRAHLLCRKRQELGEAVHHGHPPAHEEGF